MTVAAFQATYSDWKLIRTRKCVQIILEVPVEQAGQAYEALGGMPLSGEEVWVGVARLNTKAKGGDVNTNGSKQSVSPDKTSPASVASPDKPARARTPVAPDKRLAQRAGILCADPMFQNWLRETNPGFRVMNAAHDDEERAKMLVHVRCGVKSRADIIPGTEAAVKFDRMVTEFTAWRDVPEFA